MLDLRGHNLTLPVPFFVYGTVRNSGGDLLASETVYASTTSTTTTSAGKYQLNIQSVATDGVAIVVSCRGVNYSYTVDLDDLGKRIDFIIPMAMYVRGSNFLYLGGTGYMEIG